MSAQDEFKVGETLSFKAIEHWATVAPGRTALIYTDSTWKVSEGKLDRKVDPSEWKRISYNDLYNRINRLRIALHQAGVPKTNLGGYRVIVLYLPKSRVDFMVMILALQASGCVPLFASPKAFKGVRDWIKTLLGSGLKSNAILSSRFVRFLFQSFALSTKNPKRESNLKWLNATSVFKSLEIPSTETEIPPVNSAIDGGVTLDTELAVMFSGGTTGPPSPLRITHRMQCFQAAGYAGMLKERLGDDILERGRESKESKGQEGIETAETVGPWTSSHVFANFVILDLYLGGTAILQPMGLSEPVKSICPVTLKNIIHHFQAEVTSAPPSLWNRMQETCPNGSLTSLQMAFVGGAETTPTFVRDSCELLAPRPETKVDNRARESVLRDCGFYRVYATTQVLPVAIASASMILDDEEKSKACALGGGVCLGLAADGLDLSIDQQAWVEYGGRSQLHLEHIGTVAVGELCVRGKPLSPSLDVAPEHDTSSSPPEPPTRLFHTGDVCYIDPKTKHVFFLGRMSQSVECGELLGRVPAAGVETMIVESKAVPRCAFVGPTSKNNKSVTPVLVVQLHDGLEQDLSLVKKDLCAAVKSSAWSKLLQSGLRFVVYPKTWPVDERHSSKVNRFFLRDWAAKLSPDMLHEL